MGHTQQATKIQIESYSLHGIENNTVLQKLTRAMNMRFYWIQELIKQENFHILCKIGMKNLGSIFPGIIRRTTTGKF